MEKERCITREKKKLCMKEAGRMESMTGKEQCIMLMEKALNTKAVGKNGEYNGKGDAIWDNWRCDLRRKLERRRLCGIKMK